MQLGGPARGFWQFENGGGVVGVLAHKQTSVIARDALEALAYPRGIPPWSVYDALAHNDVLACVFARLLLWTLPGQLPSVDRRDDGWSAYLAAWRPGKPHIERWDSSWSIGWEVRP